MTVCQTMLADGSSGPPLPRVFSSAVVLTNRLRWFELDDRHFAHASQVPLSYLAASPELKRLLQRFVQPGHMLDALGHAPTRADIRFFDMLHRVGILLDADAPDPIHALAPSSPRSSGLMLYPTNACNLRCVYCYATSGPGAGPKLSQQHAVEAVDHFFQSLDPGVVSVVLKFHGGGEPTSNFRVMDAAWQRFNAHAQQRQLAAHAQTITNGTFGAEVLRALQAPHWRVTVSYDGVRQGAQRPGATDRDSRARVVANLRALRDSGKRLSIRATLTSDGLSSMRALVDEAAELGIDQLQIEPASIVGRGASMSDGAPDPLAFADAFLDALRHALSLGVKLSTSAWSHTRVGNGRYCAANSGTRALTPDGFLSACTEVSDGKVPTDPFLVGQHLPGQRIDIWPEREARLQSRVGYTMPQCQHCYMVDTCGGGCASRARAQSGDIFDRDAVHCTLSRHINPRLMADIAEGRLLPDAGWQPMAVELSASDSALPGFSGRLVALIPPFARARWNADAQRRPVFPAARDAACFFHLPAQARPSDSPEAPIQLRIGAAVA